VRIVDFAFSPATVTVNVGDTVTWTNEDAAPHTATASDGSFATDSLARGASESHNFAAPGTVSYFCAIHTSMRATVIVVDGAGSAGSGGGASGTSGDPTSGTSAPVAATTPTAAAELPNTGASILALSLAGVLLLCAGLLLRARTKPR
jgi:LPXTG-motif cell wall-anchored protein